jgi:CheY-like chemotaxis protein
MSDATPRPMSFLLIEDDDDHAFLVDMALRENHVVNQVRRVSDGAQAIEYLFEGVKTARNPRPDIILLDLKLPKVDGHEVLKQLKIDDDLRTIPVVVLTTSDAEVDRLKAYQSYANSYLTKPIDFDKFHQMILSLGLYWSAWNRPPVPGGSAANP